MTHQSAAGSSGTDVWIKSSYSGSDGGDCVEVATAIHATRVRDSKSIGPMLTFQGPSWSLFLSETANRAAG
ncbi:DUF397 domain-containing protein [Yinghuangia sp. ASG 101]|uniref:DUF397 domain-containing protein n=1 Tax=Yinghuangia sp. ASG 101 TaxID=2896848 RepID=UPI001E4AC6A7|nr:DUF397 domain-containing protein [Yinghuangia sp. ASG 101]UGQ11283.1 DUF397 domain-containing protein [Yinghuangia sp. ASG 101]